MNDPRHNRGREGYRRVGGGRGQATGGTSRGGGRGQGGYDSGPFRGYHQQGSSSGGTSRGGGRGQGGYDSGPFRGYHQQGSSSGGAGSGGTSRGGGRGQGGYDSGPFRGYHQQGSSSVGAGCHGRGGRQFNSNYGEEGRGGFGDRGGGGRGYGYGGYGDGRGGGRGGRNSIPASYIPLPGSFEEQVLRLQISPTSKSTDDRKKKGIVPCPTQGGKVALYNVNVLVNHFKLHFNFDKDFKISHYELDVKRKDGSPVKIKKSELFDIVKTYVRNGSEILAYDGGRNIFTPAVLNESHSVIKCRDGEYCVDVKLQKHITVADLSGESPSRVILHGLDIIMRQHASFDRLALGSSFYSTKDPHFLVNRRSEVAFLEGFRQSIKSTENGLVVCVDHSVMPFEKPVPVIEFLKKKLKIVIDRTTTLNHDQKIQVEKVLLGRRVQREYLKRHEKQKIHGLTVATSSEITFVDHTSSKTKTLAEYFLEKYRKNIQYNHLPCLSLNNKKDVFVPMEFCTLAEWKKCPKKSLTEDEDKKLRNMALVKPNIRMEKIRKIVNGDDGLRCSGATLNGFCIELSGKMEEAEARVLHRPHLRLRGPNNEVFEFLIPNDYCQWNLQKNKLSNGIKLSKWALLEFTSAHPGSDHLHLEKDEFIPAFRTRCENLGILTSLPSIYESQADTDLSNRAALHKLLSSIKERVPGGLQILICPMAFAEHEGYKNLKYICEVELGIMTQCCVSSRVNKPNGRDQYLANLALKINAKLGGVNFEVRKNRLLDSYLQHPIMFIGADVNHPRSGDTESLSIAAVVGSTDWPASSYFSIVQAQKHRKESIVGVGEMCGELIEKYHKALGFKPRRIIYFRDGVSDSQFEMVRQEELQDIKKWIVVSGYNPEITVVVTQKRHQTRLFHKDGGGVAENNVLPGTVVDKGITAPGSFNFYLCSHNGSMGTSKPGHYYVLHDEYGFTPDELEMLTYTLCYTLARCTKPVSYVTPVYYADILAYRGRQYHDAMVNLSIKLPPSSETCKFRFPLHRDIRDRMYFL